MRGFGLDGKFFRGLTKAGDFLILGLITVIFCIPVITIGASLTAAFYAGMKLVKDEENYVFKDFWKSFKTNFVQGLLVELIMGVIGLLLFFDIRACATGHSHLVQWLVLFLCTLSQAVLLYGLVFSYIHLQFFQDMMIKAITIVKNSLILCVHHLPQTFIMMIATYGLILFSLKYFTAFIVTIPLIIYVDSFIFTRIFKSLENTNDERAREAEKEKAEKIETAKQHKAIDDNVDNTAVTLNDNQSDDSNN